MFYCAFRAAANKYSNRPALAHPAVSLSYSELIAAGGTPGRGLVPPERAPGRPHRPAATQLPPDGGGLFKPVAPGRGGLFLAPPIESPQEMAAFIQQAGIKGMIISDDQVRHLEGLRHRHNLEPVILVAAMDNAGAGARMISPLLRKFGAVPPLPRKTMYKLRRTAKKDPQGTGSRPPSGQIIDPTETVGGLLWRPPPPAKARLSWITRCSTPGRRAMAALVQIDSLDVVLNASPLHTGFGLTTGLLMPPAQWRLPGLVQHVPAQGFAGCLPQSNGHGIGRRRKDPGPKRRPIVRPNAGPTDCAWFLADNAPLGSHPADELAKLSGKKAPGLPESAPGCRSRLPWPGATADHWRPCRGWEFELRRGHRLWARGGQRGRGAGWTPALTRKMEDGGRFTLGDGGRRAQVA